jgi:hypothetical protein
MSSNTSSSIYPRCTQEVSLGRLGTWKQNLGNRVAGLEAGRRECCAPANGGGVRLDINVDAARHGCLTADTAVDGRQWRYSQSRNGGVKESDGSWWAFDDWRLCRRAYNGGTVILRHNY